MNYESRPGTGWKVYPEIEKECIVFESIINIAFALNGLKQDRQMLKLEIIIKFEEWQMIRIPTHRKPTHPGEMLLEEFLKPMNITQRELSEAINVSYQRIN